MPCIELNISKKISKASKKILSDRLTTDITLIPGKTQEQVMVVIRDDSYIQMGDKFLENGAFINMGCFGTADQESNRNYAMRMYEILNEELGIDKDDIYMNLTERLWWGCHGTVVTG